MIEALGSLPLLGWWAAPLAYAVAAVVVAVSWWRHTRYLPAGGRAAVVAGALAVGLLGWVAVDVWWRPVADGVGGYVFAWLGVLTLVVLQQVAGGSAPARRAHRERRTPGWVVARVAAGLLAVTVAVGAAALATNAHLSAYRTVGAAFGLRLRVVPLAGLAGVGSLSTAPRPQGPLEAHWRPPAGLPTRGQVASADIPSSDPRFTPRKALVYLPPAYLVDGRPELPVLVLLAGQPGEPRDWLTAGRLTDTMDDYAARHGGLAPVVVIPDPLGATTANPLCSDARLGRVATYLQSDVPAWITRTLQVDEDPAHWAIAGLSNGGTCALQVVTRDPAPYRTFLSLSGELHPSLGTPAQTIAQGFGGDAAAYAANDPLTLLGRGRYDGVAGIFSAGRDDHDFLAAAERLQAAARASGMATELRTYPGGHAWTVWSMALADQAGWLGSRLGITA